MQPKIHKQLESPKILTIINNSEQTRNTKQFLKETGNTRRKQKRYDFACQFSKLVNVSFYLHGFF